jgi:predicted nucleic acid-binding protein
LIVADASAVAEVLLKRPLAASVAATPAAHTEIHVPEHFHVEVMSALRPRLLHGDVSEVGAARALASLAALRALSYPVRELIAPIWNLRANLSVYDAAYLALAQKLDTGPITLDGSLGEAAARGDGRLVGV